MLSTGEIASMRTLLETSLPGTAIVQRRTLSSDGQGGNVEAWANQGTVSCRWSPLRNIGDTEAVQGDRIAALRHRLVTLPANTSVTTADRLSIGGTIHQVQGIRAPRDWELSRQVICTEVD